jgi:hypothetical protein
MTKPKLQRDPESGKVLPKNQLALRHGLWLYKRTGKLPRIRGARALKQELVKLRQELEAVTPDMNAKKALVINQVVSSAGFLRLCEIYLRKIGLPRQDQWRRKIFDCQPIMAFYLSMARLQLQALQLLGGSRKNIVNSFLMLPTVRTS